jgi:HemY protein
LLEGQSNDLMTLHALWKRIPENYRLRTKVAAVAGRAFIKFRDCRQAGQVLRDSLNAQWDSELVSLYGDCQGETVVAQIEQAEKWLKQHTDDSGLLLALGKLCLHQGLWGKAQNYLDASNSLQPSRAAYAGLAQLAEKLGQHERAAANFQKAMELGQCD